MVLWPSHALFGSCPLDLAKRAPAALYRKVIYLEPEHVEGLMHLALMTETQGDTDAAERLRERARRIEKRAKEKAL